MTNLLGLVVVMLLAGILTLNAAVMFLSPRRWFRLPNWLAFRGSLTEDENSTGWGAVQLRLVGLVILLGIAWIVYDNFSNGRGRTVALSWWPLVAGIITIMMGMVTMNASIMLWSPQLWRRTKWLGPKGTLGKLDYRKGREAALVRLTGLVMLLIVVWFLYQEL